MLATHVMRGRDVCGGRHWAALLVLEQGWGDQTPVTSTGSFLISTSVLFHPRMRVHPCTGCLSDCHVQYSCVPCLYNRYSGTLWYPALRQVKPCPENTSAANQRETWYGSADIQYVLHRQMLMRCVTHFTTISAHAHANYSNPRCDDAWLRPWRVLLACSR